MMISLKSIQRQLRRLAFGEDDQRMLLLTDSLPFIACLPILAIAASETPVFSEGVECATTVSYGFDYLCCANSVLMFVQTLLGQREC